jgi:hypothetical protein
MMDGVSQDEKPISDQLKQVVDDLQLEERVKEVAAAAEQMVLRGLDTTGTYVRDHRGDIQGFIDRAGAAFDRQTSGRFAEQVEQMRTQLTAAVASLADRGSARPEIEAPPAQLPEGADHADPADHADRVDRADRPDPDGWAGSTDEV